MFWIMIVNIQLNSPSQVPQWKLFKKRFPQKSASVTYKLNNLKYSSSSHFHKYVVITKHDACLNIGTACSLIFPFVFQVKNKNLTNLFNVFEVLIGFLNSDIVMCQFWWEEHAYILGVYFKCLGNISFVCCVPSHL